MDLQCDLLQPRGGRGARLGVPAGPAALIVASARKGGNAADGEPPAPAGAAGVKRVAFSPSTKPQVRKMPSWPRN
jgi:hypothetical protein